MADIPKIAGRTPHVIELKTGETYYWCACGHSKTQPFCDKAHAHADTTIAPIGFTVNEDKKYALCLCKQSVNHPFCDGKHAGC